ncbi:MAG TPA: ATP-dependent Clp protease proteolytic subunit [Patescibacteria group bacterium]|nr:ATP-dependent Clp protease proteolytic subunit [Patescibacteria group bacterium]
MKRTGKAHDARREKAAAVAAERAAADAETGSKETQPAQEQILQMEAGHPRVITVAGIIDAETVERVADQLAGLNAESNDLIMVQLSSSGGHLQSGWALHDLFGTNASPVVTAGFGYVGSAATVAFQGGALRFLSPNAKLMIHLVGFSTGGDASFDLSDVRKQLKEMSELQRDIERLFARRTGQPLAKIRAWCTKETEFSARQAVKAGFADKVLRLRRPPPPRRRK